MILENKSQWKPAHMQSVGVRVFFSQFHIAPVYNTYCYSDPTGIKMLHKHTIETVDIKKKDHGDDARFTVYLLHKSIECDYKTNEMSRKKTTKNPPTIMRASGGMVRAEGGDKSKIQLSNRIVNCKW